MILDKIVPHDVRKVASALVSYKAMIPGMDGGNPIFNFKLDRIPQGPMRQAAVEFLKRNDSQVRQYVVITLAHAYGNGPKVFRLKQMDFEALENTVIRLPFQDYRQPYETVIVEFPEEYQKKRKTEVMIQDETVEHFPLAVVLHHPREYNYLLAMLVMSSEILYVESFIYGNDTSSIEDFWDPDRKFDFRGSIPTNQSETELSRSAIRTAMNACLCLEHYGYKEAGPENPSFFNRLQRYKKTEENDFQKRSHPMLLEINQNVNLYRRQSKRDHDTIPTGKRVSPHWRSGHWRMQPYGPESGLRKRIHIPAVFINPDLFLGTMSDTQVRYD